MTEKSSREANRLRAQRVAAAKHAFSMLPPGTIKVGKTIWHRHTAEQFICRSDNPIDSTHILVERPGDIDFRPFPITDISPCHPDAVNETISERISRLEKPDPGRRIPLTAKAVAHALELAKRMDKENKGRPVCSPRSIAKTNIDANIRESMMARHKQIAERKKARQTA